jgi:hypothetical protein
MERTDGNIADLRQALEAVRNSIAAELEKIQLLSGRKFY